MSRHLTADRKSYDAFVKGPYIWCICLAFL